MAQKHFATALAHGLSGQHSPPSQQRSGGDGGSDFTATASNAKRFQIDTSAEEAQQSIDSVSDYFTKRDARRAKAAEERRLLPNVLVGREHSRPRGGR